ncbi:MAG TPA: UbiA family prenyltransferase, partial [Ferruginibacter sp.]|nr:UbiA family prenyltransferase [Ferruginibacter sp.]
MNAIKKYLSLVKFAHTIFAMPFALIGFFLAAKETILIAMTNSYRDFVRVDNPRSLWLTLLLIILCMVFARSAAMAFNRWLDKNFDAKNPRTAIREIPAGIIRANSALLFVIINCLLFIVCCYFINRIC